MFPISIDDRFNVDTDASDLEILILTIVENQTSHVQNHEIVCTTTWSNEVQSVI